MADSKPKKRNRKKNEVMNSKGYSDEDFIRVMALYNLYHNLSQVSRETGISLTTVRRWVLSDDTDKFKDIQCYDQRLQSTQDRLMQSMGFVADEALQQVHKKLPEASAAQAATIYGILFDKQQIMAGNTNQGTLNLSFDLSGMSADDTASLMQRVLDRQKEAKILQVESKVIEE